MFIIFSWLLIIIEGLLILLGLNAKGGVRIGFGGAFALSIVLLESNHVLLVQDWGPFGFVEQFADNMEVFVEYI